MPSQDFYALYYSAWKLSERRRKEAEETARQEEEEAKKQKRGGNNLPPTNRQKMEALARGIDPEALAEVLEDLE